VSREEELHHAAPRSLLSLHEKANGSISLDGEGIQAWVEWEMEAMRWRVPVEISRDDLERMVEESGVVLERKKHRLLHSRGRRLVERRLRRGGSGGKPELRSAGTERRRQPVVQRLEQGRQL
jgi:hypothetical protein